MDEQQHDPESTRSETGAAAQPADDEATEAAQHVADEVSSYQGGAPEETVAAELDEGLAAAGVDVDEAERRRLTEEISDTEETPQVDDAEPRSCAGRPHSPPAWVMTPHRPGGRLGAQASTRPQESTWDSTTR
jgi:hypothetical protein